MGPVLALGTPFGESSEPRTGEYFSPHYIVTLMHSNPLNTAPASRNVEPFRFLKLTTL
jgi:hypothetical protein